MDEEIPNYPPTFISDIYLSINTKFIFSEIDDIQGALVANPADEFNAEDDMGTLKCGVALCPYKDTSWPNKLRLEKHR